MTNNLTLPLDPEPKDDPSRPLADRMRPTAFEEVVGQEHLLGEGSILHEGERSGFFPSIIFWGPPGTGKTTLARIMAKHAKARFVQASAIKDATKELREIFERAEADHKAGHRTLLFIDEIHRFNRSQQDLFLPYMEDGTFTLVGATTENPSFELNGALLSRCQVLTLKSLDTEALKNLLARAETFIKKSLPLTPEAREALVNLADGDARYLLNVAETLFHATVIPRRAERDRGISGNDTQEIPDRAASPLVRDDALDTPAMLRIINRRRPHYDKSRDGHYNLISALHKSLRGSDADAALYWFARMLEGGEDPLYITRRLIRFASEDIGLSDPQALVQALAAQETYKTLGSPEGELAIAQSVVYLATAPKSNALYTAYKAARKSAKTHGSLMPPKHILNAPTKLMKNEGYGKGYEYDHHTEEGFSGQNYFPDEMSREQYYQPVERGFERDIRKRLDYWEKLRKEKAGH